MFGPFIGRRAPDRRLGLVARLLIKHRGIPEHVGNQHKPNRQPSNKHLRQMGGGAGGRSLDDVVEQKIHVILTIQQLAPVGVASSKFKQHDVAAGLVEEADGDGRCGHGMVMISGSGHLGANIIFRAHRDIYKQVTPQIADIVWLMMTNQSAVGCRCCVWCAKSARSSAIKENRRVEDV